MAQPSPARLLYAEEFAANGGEYLLHYEGRKPYSKSKAALTAEERADVLKYFMEG